MPKTKPDIFEGQAITASDFFQNHWQKRPYLFRNTAVDLSGLPNVPTLFELATGEGVQSRIVYTEDGRRYQAIYDEPEAWVEVLDFKPTLLVSDIEKWHPKALNLLDAFGFIKSWRFDDLMMSYAPKGASVGAHTDHYDVFLVQVQGTRQWSYDDDPISPDSELVQDSELAVIDGYLPQNTAELKPGDILYLPPEIPHHGISTSDDCVTCSIGLRAPSDAEMLNEVMALLTQGMSAQERFQDGVQNMHSDASIGTHEINHLRQHLIEMSQMDDAALAELFGQVVTGYRVLDEQPEAQVPETLTGQWQKSPFSVFAYHVDAKSSELFVNGEVFVTSTWLPTRLCDHATIDLSQVKKESPSPMKDLRAIRELIEIGALIQA